MRHIYFRVCTNLCVNFNLGIILTAASQKRGSILLGIESLKIRQLVGAMDAVDEEVEPGTEPSKPSLHSPHSPGDKRKSLKRRFADAVQEAVLPSKTVVMNVQRLFASDQALNAERERHLRINRRAIHPMSKLRYCLSFLCVALTCVLKL